MWKYPCLFLQLFFLVVALVGCGRDRHQSSPVYPAACECNCEELQQKLAVAELAVSKAKELIDQANKGEDPRNCTLEYAQSKDKAGAENLAAGLAKAKKELDNNMEEVRRDLAAAVVGLPEAPASMGAPPVQVYEHWVTRPVGVAKFDEAKKLCVLEQGQDASIKGRLSDKMTFVNDWSKWAKISADEFAKGDTVGSSDENTDYYFVQQILDSRGSIFGEGVVGGRQDVASRILMKLAGSPEAMKWSLSAFRKFMNAEQQQLIGRRIERLFKASKTDFSRLSKQVAEKEASLKDGEALPAELDFVPHRGDGQYFKGLLLRYWRYHEVKGRGTGDLQIHALQKVLSGVAKDLSGINLK